MEATTLAITAVRRSRLDIEAQESDAVIATGFDTGTPPTAEQ